MSKQIFKGRNKIVLVSDDDLAIGHRSHLKYREDTPVVIPADEAGVNTNDEGEMLPDYRETEDYFFFPFRQISKTIVGAGTWKATDFSVGDVLERSTPLLNRKPAYRDHWTYVGNSIGMVVNPVWQEAYTNDLGQEIPAGIDAEFVINKNIASLQELAEHLKSPYNPYNAASVGVVFDWEASHEFESMWDFYDLLGQTITDDQGNESMVRRIVTNVEMYYESSLVSFGADHYARQKKDGKVEMYSHEDLKGVSTLDQEDQRLREEYESKGKYFVYSSAETAPQPATTVKKQEKQVPSSNSKPEDTMNKLLVGFALKALGVESIEQLKEEDIPSEVQQYGKLLQKAGDFETTATKVEGLETAKQELEGQVEQYKAEIAEKQKEFAQLTKQMEEQKPYVAFAMAEEADLKKRVKALYTASVDGKVSQAIIEEIEGNTVEVLKEKAQAYGAKLGLSGHCNECGSDDIAYRSSKPVNAKEGSAQDTRVPLWKSTIE